MPLSQESVCLPYEAIAFEYSVTLVAPHLVGLEILLPFG